MLGAFQAPVLVCSSLGKDKQSTAKSTVGQGGQGHSIWGQNVWTQTSAHHSSGPDP